MQEVEVKAKVRDKASLEEALEREGVSLSAPIVQNDVVYLPRDVQIEDLYIYPDYETLAARDIAVMRIRESNGKILLTLKKPIKNELDCIEHEVVVDNKEQMETILGACGFHEVVRFSKLRRKGRVGQYEICLDEVFDLGTFIEAEKLTDGQDSEAVQIELLKFLSRYGINTDDRVVFGYDTLVLKKKGIIP